MRQLGVRDSLDLQLLHLSIDAPSVRKGNWGTGCPQHIAGPASTRHRPRMIRVVRLHFIFESAFILVLLVGCESFCGGKRGHDYPRAKPGGWKNGRREPTGPLIRERQANGSPPTTTSLKFNDPAVGSAQITANLLMRCPYTVKVKGCQGKVVTEEKSGRLIDRRSDSALQCPACRRYRAEEAVGEEGR